MITMSFAGLCFQGPGAHRTGILLLTNCVNRKPKIQLQYLQNIVQRDRYTRVRLDRQGDNAIQIYAAVEFTVAERAGIGDGNGPGLWAACTGSRQL